MPAYNFQKQFADAVASGEKSQTIRKRRKRPGDNAQPGKPLQLYTAMRTSACRKLRTPDPMCLSVERIVIHAPCFEHPQAMVARPWIELDGRGLSAPEREALAQADGFIDALALLDWFDKTHGLPFAGVLIKWEPMEDGA